MSKSKNSIKTYSKIFKESYKNISFYEKELKKAKLENKDLEEGIFNKGVNWIKDKLGDERSKARQALYDILIEVQSDLESIINLNTSSSKTHSLKIEEFYTFSESVYYNMRELCDYQAAYEKLENLSYNKPTDNNSLVYAINLLKEKGKRFKDAIKYLVNYKNNDFDECLKQKKILSNIMENIKEGSNGMLIPESLYLIQFKLNSCNDLLVKLDEFEKKNKKYFESSLINKTNDFLDDIKESVSNIIDVFELVKECVVENISDKDTLAMCFRKLTGEVVNSNDELEVNSIKDEIKIIKDCLTQVKNIMETSFEKLPKSLCEILKEDFENKLTVVKDKEAYYSLVSFLNKSSRFKATDGIDNAISSPFKTKSFVISQ